MLVCCEPLEYAEEGQVSTLEIFCGIISSPLLNWLPLTHIELNYAWFNLSWYVDQLVVQRQQTEISKVSSLNPTKTCNAKKETQ